MASIVSAGTTSATALNMSADTTGILQLASNNGTVGLTLNTSQNVGIGTSSPAAKLDVATSTAGFAAILTNTNGASDSNGLYIKSGTVSSEYNLRLSNTSGSADFMVVKGNGNVGVGTISPSYLLEAKSSTAAIGITGTGTTANNLAVGNINASNTFYFAQDSSTGGNFNTGVAYGPVLWTNASSQTFVTDSGSNIMKYSSGNLLVGTTTTRGKITVKADTNSSATPTVYFSNDGGTAVFASFGDSSGTVIGTIARSGSSTNYNTSSDYRLKNSIAPMTGALAKVALLKPCTYKWNADGADGQGFIAHELAEVVPDCVTGEKDAVGEQQYEITPAVKDEEGRVVTAAVMGTRIAPVYQGIDTSFLVATLTAAIQELSVKVTALEEQVLNLGVK